MPDIMAISVGDSGKRKHEVCERNDKGIEFKVVFDSLDEVQDALLNLQTIKQAYKLQGTTQSLRKRCDTIEGDVYIFQIIRRTAPGKMAHVGCSCIISKRSTS
ncbi:MAG: hypothetical protein ACFFER_14450 [Candidatus Thorarchaeota archaeon]